MKKYQLFSLAVCLGLAAVSSIRAQTAEDESMGINLSYNEANDYFTLSWWASDLSVYYVQQSSDLEEGNWSYPEIYELGVNTVAGWNFQSPDRNMFFRIEEVIGEDLRDFDGDQLANGTEVSLGLNPFDSDSDDDGIPDNEEDSDGDGQDNGSDSNPQDPTQGPDPQYTVTERTVTLETYTDGGCEGETYIDATVYGGGSNWDDSWSSDSSSQTEQQFLDSAVSAYESHSYSDPDTETVTDPDDIYFPLYEPGYADWNAGGYGDPVGAHRYNVQLESDIPLLLPLLRNYIGAVKETPIGGGSAQLDEISTIKMEIAEGETDAIFTKSPNPTSGQIRASSNSKTIFVEPDLQEDKAKTGRLYEIGIVLKQDNVQGPHGSAPQYFTPQPADGVAQTELFSLWPGESAKVALTGGIKSLFDDGLLPQGFIEWNSVGIATQEDVLEFPISWSSTGLKLVELTVGDLEIDIWIDVPDTGPFPLTLAALEPIIGEHAYVQIGFWGLLARNAAEGTFPPGALRDAVRHTTWNALSAQDLGLNVTAIGTTAREHTNQYLEGRLSSNSTMDLFNNTVGMIAGDIIHSLPSSEHLNEYQWRNVFQSEFYDGGLYSWIPQDEDYNTHDNILRFSDLRPILYP